MAWTAPMTAVVGATFTASQFNIHVRDNLLETAVAKATTPGGYFVSTDVNTIAERLQDYDQVDTAETTTSGSYDDLSTVGPSVTVTTGTQALVTFGAYFRSTADSTAANMSVAVSGDTTVAASITSRIIWDGHIAANSNSSSRKYLFTGLNAGSNTFTCKYLATGGTFGERWIHVQPF
jgi:hypothetical protein